MTGVNNPIEVEILTLYAEAMHELRRPRLFEIAGDLETLGAAGDENARRKADLALFAIYANSGAMLRAFGERKRIFQAARMQAKRPETKAEIEQYLARQTHALDPETARLAAHAIAFRAATH